MHHPVDVQALDCGFLRVGHKLYGSTGIAFFIQRSLVAGDAAVEGAVGDRHRQPGAEGTTWTKASWRFEAGTPNTGGIIGLARRWSMCRRWLNNIAEYEQNSMHYALSQLESVPISLYGPQNRLGVIV